MNASALQSHPPIELAIGLLPSSEQSHVQVSMRVLASHLQVPCVVMQRETADITLKPSDSDANAIAVVSAFGEAKLERPMRLVPLSEALQGLIDGILAHEGQSAAPAPVASTSNVAAFARSVAAPLMGSNEESLLGLLLGRKHQGPIEITLRSGRTILLDGRYATAHLSDSPVSMLAMLQGDTIARVSNVDAADFAARTAKGSVLFPVGVEQLCWSLAATDDTASALSRWHEDEQARVTLDTWPNLSVQADNLAWLSVLGQLSRRTMTIAELRNAAIDAGIAPARARHGLSLLLSYRHARVVASGVTENNVVVQMPVAPKRPAEAAPTGLLGRLRMRLRALAA